MHFDDQGAMQQWLEGWHPTLVPPQLTSPPPQRPLRAPATRLVSVRGTGMWPPPLALTCYVLDVGGPERLGRSTCRGGTLSRKGAKSRTGRSKLRSTGAKAGTRVDRNRASTSELGKKLAEALEREAATSEVLRVISSSPSGLESVFQTMLANAVRICEAKFGKSSRGRAPSSTCQCSRRMS